MSALLLNEMLNHKRKGMEKVDITLVESPDIPTVGVGEATVPNMPRTLVECGISERQFFETCNTSFKLGVLFDGWNVDAEGRPISFVNPFSAARKADGVDVAHYGLRHGAGDMDFGRLAARSMNLPEGKRGPCGFRAPDCHNEISFACHPDAGKFPGLLRDTCTAHGGHHAFDNLQIVDLDDKNYVAALHLEQTGRLPVELVIDCTGVRGRVINETLGGAFAKYSDYLSNDRAMAVQVPHLGDRIEPMTSHAGGGLDLAGVFVQPGRDRLRVFLGASHG